MLPINTPQSSWQTGQATNTRTTAGANAGLPGLLPTIKVVVSKVDLVLGVKRKNTAAVRGGTVLLTLPYQEPRFADRRRSHVPVGTRSELWLSLSITSAAPKGVHPVRVTISTTSLEGNVINNSTEALLSIAGAAGAPNDNSNGRGQAASFPRPDVGPGSPSRWRSPRPARRSGQRLRSGHGSAARPGPHRPGSAARRPARRGRMDGWLTTRSCCSPLAAPSTATT